MISLYSGTPGSGKSLHVAMEIRERAIAGRPTIGNFEVNLQKYKKAVYVYRPNDQLTPAFLERYSQEYFSKHRFKEGRLLLVIDECQLIFNAREWQQVGRAQWLSFFTQHRKLGYDIILIAQFDRMIDRQIRSLIEYEYIHRKASNYGIGGKIFSLAAGGNLFIAVNMWYPLKLRIGAKFFHAKKRYYSIYDSYGMFAADGEASGGVGAPPDSPPAAEQPERNKALILLRSFGMALRRLWGFLRALFRVIIVNLRLAALDLIADLRDPVRDDYSYPGGRDALGWTPEQRAKAGNHYNPLSDLCDDE